MAGGLEEEAMFRTYFVSMSLGTTPTIPTWAVLGSWRQSSQLLPGSRKGEAKAEDPTHWLLGQGGTWVSQGGWGRVPWKGPGCGSQVGSPCTHPFTQRQPGVEERPLSCCMAPKQIVLPSLSLSFLICRWVVLSQR